MKRKTNQRWAKLTLAGIVIFVLGCGLFQNPETIPTQTKTPTSTPEIRNAQFTPETSNRCEGVSGSLEMQILAGPAEAVGMEPYAVGNIPFFVVEERGIYMIQGGGDISYHCHRVPSKDQKHDNSS